MSHSMLKTLSRAPLVWWAVVGWKRKLLSPIQTSKYPDREIAKGLDLQQSFGKTTV